MVDVRGDDKTILHIYVVDRTGTVHSGCETDYYGFQNSEQ